MLDTAVILAAGMGSRLNKILSDKPKGFLKIDNQSLIERSIQYLLDAGIKNIIIGTGHLAKYYEELTVKYPQIKCLYNNLYKTSGSLYTLYNLREVIANDFLLLESDLLYERTALKLIMHYPANDVILASEIKKNPDHDEVYVEVKDTILLSNLSKQEVNLQNIKGELVGISRLSLNTYRMLCQFPEEILKHQDYEDGLVKLAKQVNIHVNLVKDLAWCEIDDEQHLQGAINKVYPLIKERDSIMQPVKRKVLLNPGPATTTDTVKLAQIVPDICPREKEFGAVMQFISEELTKFVGNPDLYRTVLFGGSGTAAVETILSSVIDDNHVIIINNGAYGKRMVEIARVYGLKYIEFQSPLDQGINLVELENLIKKTKGEISHLAVVHNETTTGLLNNLYLLGDLCKKYKIDLLVDAMSSFGAIPIDMNQMNISFLAASSNKNLQGIAGVSFVIANRNKLDKIKDIKPRNYYLNLYAQFEYFSETGQLRFTPPVQTIYALKQAILETKEEGIDNRYNRYQSLWDMFVRSLNELGLSRLVKNENHSKIITAILEPKCSKYSFTEMHDFFYSKGYTIYPGKLEGLNTFRVANMGDLNHKDMINFINLLREYLLKIGYLSK